MAPRPKHFEDDPVEHCLNCTLPMEACDDPQVLGCNYKKKYGWFTPHVHSKTEGKPEKSINYDWKLLRDRCDAVMQEMGID